MTEFAGGAAVIVTLFQCQICDLKNLFYSCLAHLVSLRTAGLCCDNALEKYDVFLIGVLLSLLKEKKEKKKKEKRKHLCAKDENSSSM